MVTRTPTSTKSRTRSASGRDYNTSPQQYQLKRSKSVGPPSRSRTVSRRSPTDSMTGRQCKSCTSTKTTATAERRRSATARERYLQAGVNRPFRSTVTVKLKSKDFHDFLQARIKLLETGALVNTDVASAMTQLKRLRRLSYISRAVKSLFGENYIHEIRIPWKTLVTSDVHF